MLGYYAQLLGQTRMLQQTSKVHEIIIGYGTFGSEVGVASRFGLPTGIKAGGIGLDIPMSKVVVADNNNQQNFKNYRLQAGMIASSLEHRTPEQMYNTDPSNPVQGISTMKAFALANQQGQKLYTITQDNINEVLPKIQASSLTKGDIIGSVNAGKTVTVHEREVSVPGWTGTGYMVISPNGDGAFLIGGGGNGGWIETGVAVVLDVISLIKPFAKLSPVLTGVLGVLTSIVSSLEDLSRCMAQGGFINYAIITVFMLNTMMFVSYMTALLIVAGPAIGLVFSTMFASSMELMFGEMGSAIARLC